MTTEEIKNALDGVNAAASQAVKDGLAGIKSELITKEMIEAMIKTASKDAEIESFKGQLTTLANELQALKESGATSVSKTTAQELREMKDQIIKTAKGLAGDKDIEIKTLVQRSAIASNENAYDVPDIGKLATRKLTLYDLFPKVTVGAKSNGTVRYYDWDAATTARAAAAIAENGTFPASTATFSKYLLDLKKIGDTLPVTEEFFEDEQLFAAELGMFLSTNVDIAIDTQLATGDGTSNTLTGIVSSSTAFAAVASGIASPNIYDLVIKVSEGITKTGGSKYMPNFVLMNITDINKMKLTKDHNDNYILPPFVSRSGEQVGTINVIECNAITANTLVVGDNRYARIYEMPGIVLSKGMVSTQFVEDTMTLKARKRLLFLIRTVDKTGFYYVSDINAALVTLAA